MCDRKCLFLLMGSMRWFLVCSRCSEMLELSVALVMCVSIEIEQFLCGWTWLCVKTWAVSILGNMTSVARGGMLNWCELMWKLLHSVPTDVSLSYLCYEADRLFRRC